MDEIRILKGLGIAIGVGVGALATLIAPGIVLTIALAIMLAGLLARESPADREAGIKNGRALLLTGVLLLLPPLVWFGRAFIQ